MELTVIMLLTEQSLHGVVSIIGMAFCWYDTHSRDKGKDHKITHPSCVTLLVGDNHSFYGQVEDVWSFALSCLMFCPPNRDQYYLLGDS